MNTIASRRSSEKPEKFYPQRLTPWMVRGVQWLAPAIAHWFYKIDLVIAPESRSRLKMLGGKRLLLLANHPTFHDPVVVFLLSARLGERFYYLADWTQLQGRLGPFLQRMGVYSIRRGRPDRESVRHTLELLNQPWCQLVIFPEGGCSFQNDTVMPFREGAVQMALQSLARFQKDGQPVPDLYAVPLSIKYRYTQDVTPVIAALLQDLEQELKLFPSPTEDLYLRLRAVGERVLERCEADYGFQPEVFSENSNFNNLNHRIVRLKTDLLRTLEQCFNIKTTEEWPDRERVYRLQHLLAQLSEEAVNPGSWQDQKGRRWTDEQVQRGLWRVLNFDAIYDGYVAENPSPERYLDTLIRLEREVFGVDQPIPKGQREAWVFIGEPVNLKDFLPQFQHDRTTVVKTLVETLHHQVQQNLTQLDEICGRKTQ